MAPEKIRPAGRTIGPARNKRFAYPWTHSFPGGLRHISQRGSETRNPLTARRVRGPGSGESSESGGQGSRSAGVGLAVRVVADDRLGEGTGVVLEQAPAAVGLAEDGPAAVGQTAEAAPVLGGQVEEAADRDAGGAAMADHDEGAARGYVLERA